MKVLMLLGVIFSFQSAIASESSSDESSEYPKSTIKDTHLENTQEKSTYDIKEEMLNIEKKSKHYAKMKKRIQLNWIYTKIQDAVED